MQDTHPHYAAYRNTMRVELSAPVYRSARRNIYAVMLAITLAAIGLLLYDDFGDLFPFAAGKRAEAAPALIVSPWSGKLQVKWDPSSEAVRNATGGEVLIVDGAQRSRIALTPAGLRNGNITYGPQTDDVSFQFRTIGSGAPIASVRYIGAVGRGNQSDLAAAGKPEPFGDAPPQTGTADRTGAPMRPARVQPRPDAFAAVLPDANSAETSGTHRGIFGKMKRGLARMWPVHHNGDDREER